MNIAQQLSNRLRAAMQHKGMNAAALARAADVKPSFVYDILNGKSQHPSIVTLAQVAQALGVDLAFLSGQADAPAPHEACVAVPLLKPVKTRLETDQGHRHFFRAGWLASTGLEAEHLRIIRVADDAMQPTLFAGDVALISLRGEAENPAGLYALHDGLEIAVRGLEPASKGQVRVIAHNSRYGEHTAPLASLRIIGRVVWAAHSYLD